MLPENEGIETETSINSDDNIENDIRNAFEKTDEPKETKEVKEPKQRTRSEDGKFAKADEKPEQAKEEKIETSTAVTEPVPVATAAPKSWTAAAQAKWAELPTDLQAEIVRREQEVHKGFTKMDEERNFGKSLKEIITPYMPIIQADGGTPLTAVSALLNSAYILRTGSPQQKTQLFKQLATQYSVPLEELTQPAPYVDPQLQAVQNELAQLKGFINGNAQQVKQQEQASIQGQIAAFAADPNNIHYEAVKPHMVALLQNGLAKDLQDAYDQALYARPDIRSTLLDAQRAEIEAKRIADTKAKADNARRAGSSITGSPGTAIPTKSAPDRSLEDEIRENLNAFMG